MSRPEDISEEAWDEADVTLRQIVQAMHDFIITKTESPDGGLMHPIIARAIMAATLAEREACALAALGPSAEFDFQTALAECRDLEAGAHSGRVAAADAIRKRGGE